MIKVSFVKALFMLWSKNLCLDLYMQSLGKGGVYKDVKIYLIYTSLIRVNNRCRKNKKTTKKV